MNQHEWTVYSSRPLLLKSNRVWRTYAGGAMIEAWQGKPEAQDNEFPEEWVASTVQAKNQGREHIVEGLSQIVSDNDEILTLQALIASNPALFLGKSHAGKYNDNPAVLVKVIDSAERLTIQVHPDPEFAQKEFQSAFGKTEAWYILGGRTIDGEEPSLYIGFKPGMTREKWKRLFEEQNIPEMLGSLHRVPVRPGDVYLIRGGLPHAIGSGCFLIEIQEPTDYTLRTERITPRGRRIPDIGCHQGIGFEKMLDAFHYESNTYDDMLRACKIEPTNLRETMGGKELQLIGKNNRFSMSILTVQTSYRYAKEDGFIVAVVVSGSGTITWRPGQAAGASEAKESRFKLEASQQWFFPAGLRELTFEAETETALTGEPLVIVLCFPPDTPAYTS